MKKRKKAKKKKKLSEREIDYKALRELEKMEREQERQQCNEIDQNEF